MDKNIVLKVLKRTFDFAGRATRKEFWLTVLALFVVEIVFIGIGLLFCLINEGFGGFMLFLLLAPVFVASLANLFRRIHDLGLSGFWTCYLSPLGLPMMYGAYIMDSDASVNTVIEKIRTTGSAWLGWILAFLFWPVASTFGLLVILLSPGQNKDNIYGANPYVK